jgi:hypothetical protein
MEIKVFLRYSMGIAMTKQSSMPELRKRRMKCA